MAQAGDKCDFTGTLIVVPDVGSLNLPGARAESGSGRGKTEYGGTDGVSGLKALGVRDLTYRCGTREDVVIKRLVSSIWRPEMRVGQNFVVGCHGFRAWNL